MSLRSAALACAVLCFLAFSLACKAPECAPDEVLAGWDCVEAVDTGFVGEEQLVWSHELESTAGLAVYGPSADAWCAPDAAPDTVGRQVVLAVLTPDSWSYGYGYACAVVPIEGIDLSGLASARLLLDYDVSMHDQGGEHDRAVLAVRIDDGVATRVEQLSWSRGVGTRPERGSFEVDLSDVVGSTVWIEVTMTLDSCAPTESGACATRASDYASAWMWIDALRVHGTPS